MCAAGTLLSYTRHRGGTEVSSPVIEGEFFLPGGMEFGIGIDLSNTFEWPDLETNTELFPPWKEIRDYSFHYGK